MPKLLFPWFVSHKSSSLNRLLFKAEFHSLLQTCSSLLCRYYKYQTSISSTFYGLVFLVGNFGAKILYKKHIRKTLMKLTPRAFQTTNERLTAKIGRFFKNKIYFANKNSKLKKPHFPCSGSIVFII